METSYLFQHTFHFLKTGHNVLSGLLSAASFSLIFVNSISTVILVLWIAWIWTVAEPTDLANAQFCTGNEKELAQDVKTLLAQCDSHIIHKFTQWLLSAEWIGEFVYVYLVRSSPISCKLSSRLHNWFSKY